MSLHTAANMTEANDLVTSTPSAWTRCIYLVYKVQSRVIQIHTSIRYDGPQTATRHSAYDKSCASTTSVLSAANENSGNTEAAASLQAIMLGHTSKYVGG